MRSLWRYVLLRSAELQMEGARNIDSGSTASIPAVAKRYFVARRSFG
jgi:hypothetical protein